MKQKGGVIKHLLKKVNKTTILVNFQKEVIKVVIQTTNTMVILYLEFLIWIARS